MTCPRQLSGCGAPITARARLVRSNKSANRLIVNGGDVTAYGLFVEHFQQYQTLWNGNGGDVYFYQSEMPYDSAEPAAWKASPGHNGYPSYKVTDGVTSHIARGVGVYGVFSNEIIAENGVEAPIKSGVSLSHLVTASLAKESITHIFNSDGSTMDTGTMTASSQLTRPSKEPDLNP